MEKVRNDRPDKTIASRQDPRLVDEFGKFNSATADPSVLYSRGHKKRLVK